ncbi:MAG: ferrous iron transport protein B [Opitutales bacterium]
MASSHHSTGTIALIGNPNTGKTSLFNRLTGMKQRVGNYPGVTVEKKVGTLKSESGQMEIWDLPGTYSLAAVSPDERVVVDALSGRFDELGIPDLILCVVDATNLRRTLYLANQAAELGLPMVVALNFSDQARKKGITIDAENLSKRLGVPVIPTSSHQGEGLDKVKEALAQALSHPSKPIAMEWPEPITAAIDTFSEKLNTQSLTRPEATRILFDQESALRALVAIEEEQIDEHRNEAFASIRKARFQPLATETYLRYQHIDSVLDGLITKVDQPDSFSQKLDNLLIHRLWGGILFLGMMYIVFQSVYTCSGPFMDWIEAGKIWVQGHAGTWLEEYSMLQSLVVDGMIEGVGAFLVFLPQILILFFFISLLEETGYMARAAFLMDKLFSWCGLSGKSFVPMLSSYACAIPGIMATRTIEDPKSRLVTILVAPLMSCSARLPVYILLIGAFVEPIYGPVVAGLALFLMHFVGLVFAIPISWLLTRFVIKTRPAPFVLELPPYHRPNLRNTVWRVYEAGSEFISKAGTVIFAITIIIWALLYFPRPPEVAIEAQQNFIAEQANIQAVSPLAIEQKIEMGDEATLTELDHVIAAAYMEQSIMGRSGKLLQPIFGPAGFDWRITVGVLSSFPAREVIIATMGIIFRLGGDVDEESGQLRDVLDGAVWQSGEKKGDPLFTIPAVFSIMVFFALCQQCGATVATIAKEVGWRYAIFSFVYMTALAWFASILTYQLGSLII